MPLNDNDLLLINDSQDGNEAKKIKYGTLKSNINGDSGNDLQAVTDNGNHTTNAVKVGNTEASPNITLAASEGTGYFGLATPPGTTTHSSVQIGEQGNGYGVCLVYNKDSAGGITNPAFAVRDAGASTGSTTVERFNVLSDGTTQIGGTINNRVSDAPNISLNADGSGSFSGRVNTGGPTFDGIPISGQNNSTLQTLNLSNVGNGRLIKAGNSGHSMFILEGNGDAQFGGTEADPNIKLNGSDGSAEFALGITTDQGIYRKSQGGVIFYNNSVSPATGNGQANDNALFLGQVDNRWQGIYCNNNVSRSIIIETEADNPANYTATTDSDGNETQVYNGPTLDVKERILNLVSRLDALEANEVIDDAVDSSLLTLLASASSRLDSLEARIAALEGGN